MQSANQALDSSCCLTLIRTGQADLNFIMPPFTYRDLLLHHNISLHFKSSIQLFPNL